MTTKYSEEVAHDDRKSLHEQDDRKSDLYKGPSASDPPTDEPLRVLVEDADRAPKAPDGGWGWVVVFASAVSHVIIGGIERSGGVLYLQLLEKFNGSASVTAWVLSLSGGFRLLTGPLSGILTTRYGFRPVVYVGALAATLSSVLSAFAPELFYVHLAFGLLGGVGRGLCYSPSVVIVGTYFDKKRGMAIGLATSGVGLGAFLLPPLLEFLFGFFGYTGSFLLLGGYLLHLCICATLYRPLPPRSRQSKILTAEDQPRTVAQDNPDEPWCKTERWLDNEIHKATPKSSSKSSISIPRGKSVVAKTKKLLGLRLLCNPFFLSFCVTIGLFTMSFNIIFTFLPALAESKGLAPTQAALLLSIMGITDIFARIFSGVVFDFKRVRPYRRYIYNACVVLISITALLTPLARTFASFVTLSLVYGILAGLYIAQKSVIIVDIVGKDKLVSSFGMVVLFQGIGTFIGPPIAGIFRDSYKNYDMAFQFGGGVTALASVILLISNVCFFLRNRREARARKLTVES